ncbi:MAG: hypothetical protein LKKZDAJK_002887 [Candidatus Fervidibacter sp.]
MVSDGRSEEFSGSGDCPFVPPWQQREKVAGSDGVIVVLCVSCVVTEMNIASGRRTPSPFSASSLQLTSRLPCLFLPSSALLWWR